MHCQNALSEIFIGGAKVRLEWNTALSWRFRAVAVEHSILRSELSTSRSFFNSLKIPGGTPGNS